MRDESLLDVLTLETVGGVETLARLLVAHGPARPGRASCDRSAGRRTRAASSASTSGPAVKLLVLDSRLQPRPLGQRAMTDALRAWPGGLVIASHDRLPRRHRAGTTSISRRATLGARTRNEGLGEERYDSLRAACSCTWVRTMISSAPLPLPAHRALTHPRGGADNRVLPPQPAALAPSRLLVRERLLDARQRPIAEPLLNQSIASSLDDASLVAGGVGLRADDADARSLGREVGDGRTSPGSDGDAHASAGSCSARTRAHPALAASTAPPASPDPAATSPRGNVRRDRANVGLEAAREAVFLQEAHQSRARGKSSAVTGRATFAVRRPSRIGAGRAAEASSIRPEERVQDAEGLRTSAACVRKHDPARADRRVRVVAATCPIIDLGAGTRGRPRCGARRARRW